MPRTSRFHRAAARCLVSLAAVALLRGTASAQSVSVDARLIEFLPSDQHASTLPDGRPAVTQYEVEVVTTSTSQVLQRVNLGRPVLQIDGTIRADFVAEMTVTPVPGAPHTARIITTGPLGSSVSAATSPFAFSKCEYLLTSAAASLAATGGSGSLTVDTKGVACTWTASSSDAWLTVTSGTTGRGKGTVSFSASANPGAAARSAVITVNTIPLTVTQAAFTPQTIQVSTEPQLRAAIASLVPNTTILVAPGVYQLTSTLKIAGPLFGVAVKGSGAKPADVVIEGSGMSGTGAAAVAFAVSGNVTDLQIANLTIRKFPRHALLIDAGARAPRLSNLQLQDAGDALIMTGTDQAGAGVDDGILESSALDYSTRGVSPAAGGLALKGAKRWIVRNNAFRNILGPVGQAARPAIGATAGSSETVVEKNLFFNSHIGVALGLNDVADSVDHSGGRVANNFFYRAATVAGAPSIVVADSPSTTVVHNTILASGTSSATIEYRYADAVDLLVANNLVDGPIQALAGAWAIQTGNVTNATPELFVSPATGDLHLRSTAFAAIDMGSSGTGVDTDIDGEKRPSQAAPDAGADEVTHSNGKPVATLVKPKVGSVYGAPAKVQLSATAQDPDGTIAYVEFYANSILLARVSKAPYAATASLSKSGYYSIVAVAVDNNGASGSSQSVLVRVDTVR